MAILAALRITDAHLAIGDPDLLVPDAFPGIADLTRLNLRVRDARPVIEAAERSLAYMSIPFSLSVHHAFGIECLRMLDNYIREAAAPADVGVIELSDLHVRFMETIGAKLPNDLLALFDLLRVVRNRVIHYGGVRGSYLNQKWRDLPGATRAGWHKVAGRDFPTGDSGEELPLGIGELIGALMVVTRLGREMNSAMAHAIDRAVWARIAIDDLRATSPEDDPLAVELRGGLLIDHTFRL